jgi:hypothetical protein
MPGIYLIKALPVEVLGEILSLSGDDMGEFAVTCKEIMEYCKCVPISLQSTFAKAHYFETVPDIQCDGFMYKRGKLLTMHDDKLICERNPDAVHTLRLDADIDLVNKLVLFKNLKNLHISSDYDKHEVLSRDYGKSLSVLSIDSLSIYGIFLDNPNLLPPKLSALSCNRIYQSFDFSKYENLTSITLEVRVSFNDMNYIYPKGLKYLNITLKCGCLRYHNMNVNAKDFLELETIIFNHNLCFTSEYPPNLKHINCVAIQSECLPTCSHITQNYSYDSKENHVKIWRSVSPNNSLLSKFMTTCEKLSIQFVDDLDTKAIHKAESLTIPGDAGLLGIIELFPNLKTLILTKRESYHICHNMPLILLESQIKSLIIYNDCICLSNKILNRSSLQWLQCKMSSREAEKFFNQNKISGTIYVCRSKKEHVRTKVTPNCKIQIIYSK